MARPAFFEVELQLDGLGASAWATSLARWHQLSPTEVCLQPSMEDIQSAINGGAVAGATALVGLSCAMLQSNHQIHWVLACTSDGMSN